MAASWTEIDGVPVVWAPFPGPLRATLMFRTGIADETAPVHGITHLLEHLTLHGLHDRPYAYNGGVDLTRTVFYCTAEPAEVVEFLATVCARLPDPPADRVAVERGVLRAEADGRGGSYRDALLLLRYGAQRHGLAGVDEYGLRWLGVEAVRQWSAARFGRGNAVLWLSGPPPAGLRLPLPDGPRQPVVRAEPVETAIPGWVRRRAAGVGVSLVAPRTAAGVVASMVLADAANIRLRFERGLTYSVVHVPERLDDALAHLTVSADAAPERQAALHDELVALLDRLAGQGPEPDALARAQESRRRADEEARALGDLDRRASDLLEGRPTPDDEESEAEYAALTPDGVHAVLRAMRDSALLLVPEGVEPPAAFAPVPMASVATVDGVTYPPAGYHTPSMRPPPHLVCGAEGVSIVHDGRAVTVRWRDTVAVGWWGNGGRVLLGRDGFRITVVPGEWQNGDAVVRWIDQVAPPGTLVPLGDAGPVAAPAAPPPFTYQRRRESPWLAWAAIAVLTALALLFGAVALSGPEPPQPDGSEFGADDVTAAWVLSGLLLAGAGTGAVLRVRADRRHRAGQAEGRSVPS